MNIGEIIYYYRILRKMTQEELAEGICAPSYLSKIENGKTEASEEIVSLLFERLGVDWDVVKLKEGQQEISQLLHQWYRTIKYRNIEQARKLYEQLSFQINQFLDPNLINTYNIYRFRYYILINDLDSAKQVINNLDKQSKGFTLEQQYNWNQFLGLYETVNNRLDHALNYYRLANEIRSKLFLIDNEFLYQLAYVHTRKFQVTHAIIYAKEALEGFFHETNLNKCIHCHILLGINFVRLQDFQLAYEHYQKALTISESLHLQETSDVIYHNIGSLYSKKGEHSKAIEYFLMSYNKINPTDIRSLLQTIYDLSKEYLLLSKLSDAENWLNLGIKQVTLPEMEDLYYKFMVLKYKLKQLNEHQFIPILENEIIPYFQQLKYDPYLLEVVDLAIDYFLKHYQYKKVNYYLLIQKEFLSRFNIL